MAVKQKKATEAKGKKKSGVFAAATAVSENIGKKDVKTSKEKGNGKAATTAKRNSKKSEAPSPKKITTQKATASPKTKATNSPQKTSSANEKSLNATSKKKPALLKPHAGSNEGAPSKAAVPPPKKVKVAADSSQKKGAAKGATSKKPPPKSATKEKAPPKPSTKRQEKEPSKKTPKLATKEKMPPKPFQKGTTPKKEALQPSKDAAEVKHGAEKTMVQAAEKSEPAKDATTAFSRRCPVDREVPQRGNFAVHEDYAITLNQTNIEGNNNKFYIIQVLEQRTTDEKSGDVKYFAWNRWGRVGERGMSKLEPCADPSTAVASFTNKFREKTLNCWAQRHSFTPRQGKYTIVEMDVENEEAGGGNGAAPMGKLSVAQIEKGQVVLRDIKVVLEATLPTDQRRLLSQLSSLFFTLIPTDFGRTRPEPITSMPALLEKEELLKFFLRMGFEEVEVQDTGMTPITGVMNVPLCSTLLDAVLGCCDRRSAVEAVKKGAALERRFASTLPINKEEYGSILLYTSNAIYRSLNQVLRGENRALVKPYFQYLRMLFSTTEKLPQKPMTLWRGISVDLSAQYSRGAVITWWGISSCTADATVARNFMRGCGGACSFLTIDSKTAVDISFISFYSNEKESLLMPGTQLLVKDCTKNGNVAEIYLEEVGRLVS